MLSRQNKNLIRADTSDGGIRLRLGLYGRLGHGDTDDQYLPLPVEALEGAFVRDVASGYDFNLALVSSS